MPAATPTEAPAPAQCAPAAGPVRAAGVPVLTVPGQPVHVSTVRAFTAAALRACGLNDDGTGGLLVSELVSNSLQHSGSARPGGQITIAVLPAGDRVLIEVTDDGGDDQPALRAAGSAADAEDGRGLLLVSELSDGWGHYRRDGRQVTWFTLTGSRDLVTRCHLRGWPAGPPASHPRQGRDSPHECVYLGAVSRYLSTHKLRGAARHGGPAVAARDTITKIGSSANFVMGDGG